MGLALRSRCNGGDMELGYEAPPRWSRYSYGDPWDMSAGGVFLHQRDPSSEATVACAHARWTRKYSKGRETEWAKMKSRGFRQKARIGIMSGKHCTDGD